MSSEPTLLCESGCGSKWLNPNHTRCEACGTIRSQHSIGFHLGYQHCQSTITTLTRERDRAVRALKRAGFTDHGGQEWKPPLGAPQARTLDLLDEARREVERLTSDLQQRADYDKDELSLREHNATLERALREIADGKWGKEFVCDAARAALEESSDG